MADQHAFISAPFGSIVIGAYKGQITAALSSLHPTHSPQLLKSSADSAIQSTCMQILQYLSNPAFAFTISIPNTGTMFQQRVWRMIAEIPPGRTRSYAEIARDLGSGPRAVANACGANPLPIIVPCHRVVASKGLGGFMQGADGGLSIKRWLLRHEGVVCE